MGPLRVENLTPVLVATIVGAKRPRRQSDLRAHSTNENAGSTGGRPRFSSTLAPPARGACRSDKDFQEKALVRRMFLRWRCVLARVRP